MAGVKPKIFISHSSSGDADARAFVTRLRERLSAWGADPWLDLDRLTIGQIWNDTLRHAIARCDAAVLVVTTRYIRTGAHYARDEALLFAQRAATEAFDDFRLLVLLGPGTTTEQLRADPDWANLEIDRLQVRTLASLDPAEVDVLHPTISELLERYRSGAVPLVLREHYAEQIAQRTAAVLAQAAAELELAFGADGATPRRFVNVVLAASPELRRTLDVLQRCLQPWRAVLDEPVRQSLGWDSVAFTWIDEGTADKVALVARDLGQAGRSILVLTTDYPEVAQLHLRRVRQYVAPYADAGVSPAETTREGLLRAVCQEVRARRSPWDRRDPLTIPVEKLDGLARELNGRAGAVNPVVVALGRDLCDPDLLEGLADLFSNVIFVALADELQVDDLVPVPAVVVRPDRETDALTSLYAVIA